VVSGLRRLIEADRRVYYIVGNHDIALEHLIGSWMGEHICPFLNVRSGNQRIRIEHGHLYDPFFFKYPRLYEWVTKMAGPFLHFRPGLYTVWIRYQKLKAWFRGLMIKRGRTEQATPFHRGAEMLLMRGFDAVIFGHTHKPEDLPMADGRYLNAGNWVSGGTYVEINRGEVTLKSWDP